MGMSKNWYNQYAEFVYFHSILFITGKYNKEDDLPIPNNNFSLGNCGSKQIIGLGATIKTHPVILGKRVHHNHTKKSRVRFQKSKIIFGESKKSSPILWCLAHADVSRINSVDGSSWLVADLPGK